MGVPVLGVIVGLIGKIFIAMTAIKIFFITLIVVVLPIVLNNFLYKFLEMSFTLIDSYFPQDTSNLIFQLSGVAAYLSSQLGLVDAFNIMLSFLAAKFVLSMVPFSPFR